MTRCFCRTTVWRWASCVLRTPRLASNLGHPWNGAWNARGGPDCLSIGVASPQESLVTRCFCRTTVWRWASCVLRTPRLASNLGHPWNGAWNARGGPDCLSIGVASPQESLVTRCFCRTTVWRWASCVLRTPRLASNLGYPWNGAWNARGGPDCLAGWPRLLANRGGVATRVPGDEVFLSNDGVALGLLRASHRHKSHRAPQRS
ncbi:hypothetical protein Pan216_11800 [Planctomycetes bacterium Pan216]|uniref:Uncharacterized protein n=1 Tax=Kolteria novifilia TaxID=2527975 RepID=A0A518B050_9BACT|nr:hypothetical protein Pan216_11800 [Planctomycetes bacterium Pan216]